MRDVPISPHQPQDLPPGVEEPAATPANNPSARVRLHLPPGTYVLGLTGPIAAGKSTVAAMLARHGAIVVDAAVIGRRAVAPGEPALAEVIAEFGRDYLRPDGELDRSALAARVFADPESRRRLNAIVHPRMEPMLIAALEQAARQRPGGVVVLEAAVLLEAGWDRLVHAVALVTAKQSTRMTRLIRRQGLAPSEARARILGLRRPADRRRVRWVISTDAPEREVQRQVERLWQTIASARRPPDTR